jgi:hypothetical protein
MKPLKEKESEKRVAYICGKVVVECGKVYLFKQSEDKFAVVYGLEYQEGLSKDEAARLFGLRCLRQAGL